MLAATEGPRADRVELILERLDALPTLSPVARRLMAVGSPADADLREVAAVIESDPALTIRVLSLCRRAHLGLGSRITSVRQAVTMLGLEAVQAAVLSVEVYEVMSSAARRVGESGRAASFDQRGFWRHSIGVACAAEMLAGAHPRLGVSPDEGFVAGLLHDVGKFALAIILPKSYERVLQAAQSRPCALATAERAVLGLDHHTAGKRLAERWGLPHALQDVIWLHGQAAASIPALPHRAVVSLVTAANALARSHHLGWCGEGGASPKVEEIAAEHGLDAGACLGVSPRLHDAVAERCRLLGLEDQSAPELLLASIGEANRRLGALAASLDERQRSGRWHERVLTAIAEFHAQSRAGGLGAAVGAVVKSAAGLFGAGFFVLIFQPRAGEPWHVFHVSPEGRVLRTERLEPPRELGGDARALGSFTESGVSMAALGLLPWLADYAGEAPDIRRVRVLALGGGVRCSGPEAESGVGGFGAASILLHDRELPDGVGSPLRALTAVWGSALASAAAHDGARRLGEQLADANRTLAEAQAAIAESQSLVRLGEMTAGAAHEMNNPLTLISGRSQLLASRLTDARDKSDAVSIVAAAHDLTDLITSLRLIADPPRPEPRVCFAHDVVREALARVSAGEDGASRVQVVMERGVGPGMTDAEMLSGALSELVANALECSSDAVVVLRVQPDAADDRLLISVEDHGPGMSARALRHAFDPFFSEKPAGRQRGLGLTRARRLVEGLGGAIALRSSPGEGTTATITLRGWRSGEGSESAALDAA